MSLLWAEGKGDTVLLLEQLRNQVAAIELRSKTYNLDDVFSALVRDADGRTPMKVKGKSQRQ